MSVRPNAKIAALPARTVDEVLRVAAAAASAAAARESRPPLVRLHLAHGAVIGVPWRVDDRRGRACLVLQSGDDDVTYVELSTVMAVEVVSASAFSSELSDGAVAPELRAPAGAGAPPTRLALRRRVDELSTRLRTELGLAVVLRADPALFVEGEPLRVLDAFLGELVEVLRALGKDELGAAALRDVAEVVVVPGSTGVRREGENVIVSVAPEHGARGVLERAPLRAAIEKAL